MHRAIGELVDVVQLAVSAPYTLRQVTGAAPVAAAQPCRRHLPSRRFFRAAADLGAVGGELSDARSATTRADCHTVARKRFWQAV